MAWTLEAHFEDEGSHKNQLIAMAGVYLDSAVSSFMAETLAFEHCTDYFVKFVQQHQVVGGGTFKKRRTTK